MMSPDGSAKAASGHKRIPIANGRNPKHARTRIRRELNDILYPGALTSQLKQYAAEQAPDGANLTAISERTANGAEKAGHQLMPKRIGQLSANLRRDGLIVDAIVIREPVVRHPKGPKQEIPDRKSPGKVCIAP